MLSIKDLNQKISGIKRSTAALRENIHTVLCNAAAHAYVHGDVTPFDKLYSATSGVNRKRIAIWVRDNGFATLQSDGTHKLNKKDRKSVEWSNGDELIAYLTNDVPAWYASEETASTIARELDAVARIKSLTAQIKKDGAVIKHVNFAEYRQAMEDLDAAMREVA